MHLPTSQWEWSEEKPCGCLPDGKGSLAQEWAVRQGNILQGEAREGHWSCSCPEGGQLEAACNRGAPNFPPHIDFLGSHDSKVTIKCTKIYGFSPWPA